MTTDAKPSPWRTFLTSARDFGAASNRGLPGWAGVPVFLFAALISLGHILANTFFALPDFQMSVLHFAGLALLTALLIPMRKTERPRARAAVLAFDIAVGLLAVASTIAVIMFEEALYERGLRFQAGDWVASLLLAGLAIELTRRTAGWLIPILIVLTLSYAVWWGARIGGVFAFPGLSLETMLFRSVYSSDGMFGVIARISWTYVFMFILFGAFLVRSGAGDFIIALARAAAGRVTGGPGMVAVAASGLMGSVTGSAVANTVSTGVITIPLMKKAGFPPRFAGGVEAAASTGGQLMPPVMGAGAFLMANFTGLSYLHIIAAAALPALLYFLSVGFFVRIEAKKQNLTALADEDAIPIGEALRRGWPLLLPIAVLVALLVAGFTPTYAAGFSILAVVAASWLTANRMGPVAVLEALANGARTMAPTAVLLIAVGLIINVLTTTGVGNTFSLMIADWAGGSLIIAIILVALASLVLGMGLPVTAAYIVLAAISAPTLHGMMMEADLVLALARGEITEMAREAILIARPEAAAMLGAAMPLADARELVEALTPELRRAIADTLLDPALVIGALLSAHMIIFWLSQDSNVTPPVALAAFAAAGIAGSRPMATGFVSWKLAKGLYIIPLMFAYTPLVSGSFMEALPVALFAVAGLYAFAGVFEGHLEGPVTLWQRAVLAVATALLLSVHGLLWLDLVGLVLLAGVFWMSRPRGAPAPS